MVILCIYRCRQGRYESGWLEMFNPTTNTWDNRYFVFEKEMITHSKYSEEQLDMMKIQQYQANFNKKLNKQSDANVNDNQTSVVENEVVEIPIRNIVSFRAQNSISEGASHSTLTVSIKRNDREEKLKLRANSQDEVHALKLHLNLFMYMPICIYLSMVCR